MFKIDDISDEEEDVDRSKGEESDEMAANAKGNDEAFRTTPKYKPSLAKTGRQLSEAT